MGLVIEKAKSGRSACSKCHQLISKGAPRVRFSAYRESANICLNCIRSELVLLGVSLVPLTERDFADIAAARMMGMKKDGLDRKGRRNWVEFSTPLKVETDKLQ